MIAFKGQILNAGRKSIREFVGSSNRWISMKLKRGNINQVDLNKSKFQARMTKFVVS